jgi:hypothetical protein
MATSFKEWVSTLTQETSGQTAEATAIINESKHILCETADDAEAEVAGLNFQSAVASHQNWKARFRAMIESGIVEALDPKMIAQDNQCAIGKWIYGPAKEKYGSHPLYEKLRSDHAVFHTSASRVLEMILRGDTQNALHEIERGDFSRATNDMIIDLALFYKVVVKE